MKIIGIILMVIGVVWVGNGLLRIGVAVMARGDPHGYILVGASPSTYGLIGLGTIILGAAAIYGGNHLRIRPPTKPE